MRIKIGKRSYKPSEIRKAMAVATGMVLELSNQTLEQFSNAPSAIHTGLTVVIGLGTVVATFLVRNAEVIDATDYVE